MRDRRRLLQMRLLGAALALVSVSPARAELLSNGSFDTNIDGWADPSAQLDTTFVWSYIDAHEDPASGSLLVTTNLPEAGLDGPWQCAATTPGDHSLSAMAYRHYPAQHIEPFTEMSLDFYVSEDCSGAPLLGGLVSDVAISGDMWEPLAVQATAPEDTHSAMVRFLVGGTYDTYADPVYFDDASLTSVPEPAGAASSLAAIAALAAARAATRRFRVARGSRVD